MKFLFTGEQSIETKRRLDSTAALDICKIVMNDSNTVLSISHNTSEPQMFILVSKSLEYSFSLLLILIAD
jgi:hypothetical protein